MLKEDQVIELLERCEKLIGFKLSKIRGHLKKASSRSDAIWELLVLEATSKIGLVEYEPKQGESPDIKLVISNGRDIWIEVKYLYPRFWKDKRKSFEVNRWIYLEAKRRGIPPYKIHPIQDGISKPEGQVRELPKLNEKNIFLKDPEIKSFFEKILANSNKAYSFKSSEYTISIDYRPHEKGPYLSSSGLAQESPKTIKEHAVFRALDKKAKKQKVNAPRIICLGSDQSPVLSDFNTPMQSSPSIKDAVNAVFSKHSSISAVIIVTIVDTIAQIGINKIAHAGVLLNPNSKYPLTQEEYKILCSLNFNRWKYTYSLQRWKPCNMKNYRYSTGNLTISENNGGVNIEMRYS